MKIKPLMAIVKTSYTVYKYTLRHIHFQILNQLYMTVHWLIIGRETMLKEKGDKS